MIRGLSRLARTRLVATTLARPLAAAASTALVLTTLAAWSTETSPNGTTRCDNQEKANLDPPPVTEPPAEAPAGTPNTTEENLFAAVFLERMSSDRIQSLLLVLGDSKAVSETASKVAEEAAQEAVEREEAERKAKAEREEAKKNAATEEKAQTAFTSEEKTEVPPQAEEAAQTKASETPVEPEKAPVSEKAPKIEKAPEAEKKEEIEKAPEAEKKEGTEKAPEAEQKEETEKTTEVAETKKSADSPAPEKETAPEGTEKVQAPKVLKAVLAINPPEDLRALYAVNMTRPVDLKVVALVKSGETYIATLEFITEPSDGAVTFEDYTPHITLVTNAEMNEKEGVEFSTKMIKEIEKLHPDLLKAEVSSFSWSGEVPASEEGSPSKTVSVEVIRDKNLILRGTLCLSPQWNEEKLECGSEDKCGFCRFMKAGPCGEVFRAWEACVDEGENFVERCTKQTLALKDCVDAHPVYYFSLTDKKGSEEKSANKA